MNINFSSASANRIDQIKNGQISANFASKKYAIPRATIHYWMKKLSNYSQEKTGISKNDQIRKLKEKIEDLEFVKEFQAERRPQALIIEFEKVTGEELSNGRRSAKFLPDWLTKKAERRPKEKTFKVRWIYESIGISKQAYSQRLKADLIRDSEKEKVIAWVIEYRKKLPHRRSD